MSSSGKIPTMIIEDPTFLDSVGIKIEDVDYHSDDDIMNEYASDIWKLSDSGKKVLNESVFANYFRDMNNIVFANGVFYSKYGRLSDEQIEHEIWDSVSGSVTTNVAPLCRRLKDALRLASIKHNFKPFDDVIPFQNGELDTSTWTFYRDRLSPVPYRLPCNLAEGERKTPHFDNWIDNLFYPEDVPTIQQFLGYCLLPTTAADKALFLVGEGGAGKSVLGTILDALLGDATINVPNTKEFLENKFKIAELENKLTLYDDDLDAAALTETGFYKKLITNKQKIIVERKHSNPFEIQPRVRIIACCNQMLSSVYDNSEGFWRRLLPIQVKPKRPDFVPDPHFYSKVRAEKEGILQWALIGLQNLVAGGWKIPESARTRSYLATRKDIDDPLPVFIHSQFSFGDSSAQISSKKVSEMYRRWCITNDIGKPASSRFVQTWLSDNAPKLGITPTNNIKDETGVRCRGYLGMKPKDPSDEDYNHDLLIRGEDGKLRIRLVPIDELEDDFTDPSEDDIDDFWNFG